MLKRLFYAIGMACCVLHFDAAAQCEVEASIFPKQVACGDEAFLTATGKGQGLQVFNETFNSGAATGWGFTQQALFTNPCSPGDGTIHLWMGNSSASPRTLVTKPYNFSTASSGVTICFDMDFATQGDNAPSCEGPDLPEEGVYLQYSTDSLNWVTINYFDPNGGTDPQLINWNNWCFELPSAALTAKTWIRWNQIADSGPDYDHWGVDNVQIYFNDPTYEIVWQHDGYNYGQGSSGGENTRPVRPRQTTTYTVTMSNGPYTCTDTVELIVIQPTVTVDAGDDLRVCDGECATINATSKVVKSPAKVITYENNERVEIVPSFPLPGPPVTLDMNITTLNMTNVLPGSILSVCIDSFTYFSANIINVSLVCPSGQRILLVPAGSIFTTPGTFLVTYDDACFTPAATDSVSSDTLPPIRGSFIPQNSLSGLEGCTANGVWSLEISSSTGVFFAAGTLAGWSITFDDPEISYTAELTWAPTAGLSDSNSVSPTVCPTQNLTYILSGSDTAGCVTDYDTVGITVDTTDLAIAAALTNPNCGATDGAIDLTVGGGSGTYQYVWNNGAVTEDITGVGTGIYSVVVTDPAHCAEDTVFNLSTTTGPVINSITPTAESCFGLNNGAAVVSAVGTVTYRWSNGRTTASITGLAPGDYTVTVTDGLGCQSVAITTVNAGSNVIATVTTTDESCGAACDGAATVTANGVPTLTYAWSDGSMGTPARTGLCYGLYGFTVTDANGCTESSSFFINGGPQLLVNLGEDLSFCQDGSRTLDAGPGFTQYNWSTSETTQTIDVTESADYIVTVSNGPCFASDTISVDVVANPVINALDTFVSLGDSIALSTAVSGGVAGTYQWNPASDDLSCVDCPAPLFTPSAVGEVQYVVTFIENQQECLDVDTITITVLPENLTPIVPTAFTPNGDGENEFIYVLPAALSSGVKEFRVYNRWGQEVHNATERWDGKFEGKDQPIGTFTYYAVVQLPDGTPPRKISGAFSLLR